MAELTAAFSNPAGADAAVMAVMASNPTCGGCLTKCASAADATSCAMGCTTAASVALPAAGACSFDKFTMLRAAGGPDNAMKVLDTISATDPACGGCLKSIAVAAAADPSVLMACANSDAKSQLQAMLGGGSQPNGSGSSGAAGGSKLVDAACDMPTLMALAQSTDPGGAMMSLMATKPKCASVPADRAERDTALCAIPYMLKPSLGLPTVSRVWAKTKTCRAGYIGALRA
jgi:hypothetical protein